MAYRIPDGHPIFLGRSYGLKVLDPVDGHEIFNAKYPIFGHDFTDKQPRMITHRIVCSNSDVFAEPWPNINFVTDGQFHTEEYPFISNRRVATIPHNMGRVPLFMVTGSARVRRGEKMRFFKKDQPDGVVQYSNIYLPTPLFTDFMDFAPQFNGVNSPLPYPLSIRGMRYNGVPELNTVNSGYFNGNFTFYADTTNIYIHATLNGLLQHQSLREWWGGFDRYMKFWPDLTGSWYQFTFYILPYYRDRDIFIR